MMFLDRTVAELPSSAVTFKPLVIVAVVGALLVLAVSAIVIIRRRK